MRRLENPKLACANASFYLDDTLSWASLVCKVGKSYKNPSLPYHASDLDDTLFWPLLFVKLASLVFGLSCLFFWAELPNELTLKSGPMDSHRFNSIRGSIPDILWVGRKRVGLDL